MWHDGEDVVVELILTNSCHYILPLDGFTEPKLEMQAYDRGREKVALHAEDPDKTMDEVYGADWGLQRMTRTGTKQKYLKVDIQKLNQLERSL